MLKWKIWLKFYIKWTWNFAQMSIKNVRHLFPKNISPETFDPFILRLNVPLLAWLGLTFPNGSLNKSFFPYTFLEDINLPHTFFHSTSRFRYLQWYLTHTHTHNGNLILIFLPDRWLILPLVQFNRFSQHLK